MKNDTNPATLVSKALKRCNPYVPKWLCRRMGDRFFKRQHYDQALLCYTGTIHPQDRLRCGRLGICYGKTGDEERMEHFLARAADLGSRDAMSLLAEHFYTMHNRWSGICLQPDRGIQQPRTTSATCTKRGWSRLPVRMPQPHGICGRHQTAAGWGRRTWRSFTGKRAGDTLALENTEPPKAIRQSADTVHKQLKSCGSSTPNEDVFLCHAICLLLTNIHNDATTPRLTGQWCQQSSCLGPILALVHNKDKVVA